MLWLLGSAASVRDSTLLLHSVIVVRFFFFFFSIFFTVKVDVFGAFACRNRGCAVRSLTYFATLRPQVVLLFRFWASPFKRNKTIRMLFETAFTVKVTLWCLWYILIECPCFNVGVFFFFDVAGSKWNYFLSFFFFFLNIPSGRNKTCNSIMCCAGCGSLMLVWL